MEAFEESGMLEQEDPVSVIIFIIFNILHLFLQFYWNMDELTG